MIDTFNVPKTAAIRHIIQTLLLRLDQSESVTSSNYSITAPSTSSDAHDDEDSSLPKQLSLKEQMEQVTKDALSTMTFTVQRQPTDVGRTLTNAIKAEMQLYASTGNQGRCLQKVCKYLTSVPATSVEVEPAFSAAGVLCTCLLYTSPSPRD